MRQSFLAFCVLATGWTVSACGDDASGGEDGLTPAEERRLDQAAQRLDDQRERYEAELDAQLRADAAAGGAAAGQRPAGGSTPAAPATDELDRQ